MGRDSGAGCGYVNLRSVDTYLETLWDWSFLNDCFGHTRIRVTDIDGVVERNGHFLYIETKSPGASIPQGQALMFEALTRQPNSHVLIIWGEPNMPEKAQFWGKAAFSADAAVIRSLVKRWFAYANEQKGNQ